MKKHIDLFSGIGGFALAIDRVWKNVEHVFCDNEPFSQEIIKKHFSNSYIYGDIRTLTANAESQRVRGVAMERKQNKKTADTLISGKERAYILTGGFPCQPFSQAGRRRGTEDDRYLWPEMLRVIQEFHPRWVVGENVSGLASWNGGMVLEQIHTDLEGEGYEVQAFIIPACGVNAPHRRDRVWIVAYSQHEQARDTIGSGHDQGAPIGTPRPDKNVANPDTGGVRRHKRQSIKKGTITRSRSEWNKRWFEVATSLCRVDDGLPRRLDRTPRLKALGNAIVPQVAEEIMRAIQEVEKSICT